MKRSGSSVSRTWPAPYRLLLDRKNSHFMLDIDTVLRNMVRVQLFDARTSTLSTNQLACVRVYLVSRTKRLNLFQSWSDYYARCSSHSSVLNKLLSTAHCSTYIFIHIIVFEPTKIRRWWPKQHRTQSKMEQMKQIKQRIMPLCFSSFICTYMYLIFSGAATRRRHIVVFYFSSFWRKRKKSFY